MRADLEPFIGVFGQHARRKGTKILPVLDLLIEDIAHLRPARIGEQRTVAQRPGPELHAALKPCDDLAIGDHLRGVARGRLASPRRETGRLHRRQNVTPLERRPEIRRRIAALGRTFLLGAMHGKGSADRRARVVWRRRYEQVGKFTGPAGPLHWSRN